MDLVVKLTARCRSLVLFTQCWDALWLKSLDSKDFFLFYSSRFESLTTLRYFVKTGPSLLWYSNPSRCFRACWNSDCHTDLKKSKLNIKLLLWLIMKTNLSRKLDLPNVYCVCGALSLQRNCFLEAAERTLKFHWYWNFSHISIGRIQLDYTLWTWCHGLCTDWP